MRGEIDYAESLRQRVGLLQGLDEGALLGVYEERLPALARRRDHARAMRGAASRRCWYRGASVSSLND